MTIHYAEEFQILLQALIAMVLGGLLGWEREASGKWAGFRYLRSDPTRLIEAIAVGISFIGAGTIFRDRDETRQKGLTTAASLLATAPIGLAIALERYIVACGVTLLALFILRTLHGLENRFLDSSGRSGRRDVS